MDKKKEARDIINSLRKGDISWVRAQDKICALLDVSQQRELYAFSSYMVKNSYPNDGKTAKDYVEEWLSI